MQQVKSLCCQAIQEAVGGTEQNHPVNTEDQESSSASRISRHVVVAFPRTIFRRQLRQTLQLRRRRPWMLSSTLHSLTPNRSCHISADVIVWLACSQVPGRSGQHDEPVSVHVQVQGVLTQFVQCR